MSPPLNWSGAPEGTKSYALIAEDINNPAGPWTLWVLYNMGPTVTELAEGIPTSTALLPDGTAQGINDQKQNGYYGPCPPQRIISYQEEGWFKVDTIPPQKHVFTVYALDENLGLVSGITKAELVKAMEGHVLAQADTRGKFTPPHAVGGKGGPHL